MSVEERVAGQAAQLDGASWTQMGDEVVAFTGGPEVYCVRVSAAALFGK